MAPRPHSQRVRARRCAVQALYQWLLAEQPPKEIIKEFIADRELINVDMDYFSTLTETIPEHYQQLQALIDPHLDRDWEQIDPVEKCVLLVGTFELTSCPEIPWKVVINEAVSLCKMFGSEDAHKYINGVLDKVAACGSRNGPLGVSTPIKA
ncbi:MAG: transcription antitermination factor NusB [Gammaproteobacteria bacterium]